MNEHGETHHVCLHCKSDEDLCDARGVCVGSELRSLKAQVQRLDVQLAGVLTVVLGVNPEVDVKSGDYGWSLAYEEVKQLWLEKERLRRLADEPPTNYSKLHRPIMVGKAAL